MFNNFEIVLVYKSHPSWRGGRGSSKQGQPPQEDGRRWQGRNQKSGLGCKVWAGGTKDITFLLIFPFFLSSFCLYWFSLLKIWLPQPPTPLNTPLAGWSNGTGRILPTIAKLKPKGSRQLKKKKTNCGNFRLERGVNPPFRLNPVLTYFRQIKSLPVFLHSTPSPCQTIYEIFHNSTFFSIHPTKNLSSWFFEITRVVTFFNLYILFSYDAILKKTLKLTMMKWRIQFWISVHRIEFKDKIGLKVSQYWRLDNVCII